MASSIQNIKVLLWDIDGTILNFLEAEKNAIRQGFAEFNLGECTDEMLAKYSAINKKYWERLERNEITKPQVLEGRFYEFFESEGIRTDVAADFNSRYQVNLGNTICFNDDAYELVSSLKGKVKQYAVTNGTKVAQANKLKRSGLDQIFDGVFISDEIGVEKPMQGFFDAVWEKIGPVQKDEVMIIGDSLSSDILGGNNAGILCCWYNPKKQKRPEDLRIEYEIENLQEVLEILGGIAEE